ncbi:MAG: S-methyl-5'-thioinosine phosphorylase [Gammaproteobacteria bacterium]|nr:S-methyl-5'-thioinosine phosphorylase [Gammaproteobacteria bacterium]
MLAIIGGSGLSRLDILQDTALEKVTTPFSESAVEILTGSIGEQKLAFLPRHGKTHVIPPHKINYQANLWALHQLGVTDIVSVNAVGGIDPQMAPGQLAIPDQIIDYTHGRLHTYYQENLSKVVHIDFTHPYSKRLRHLLIVAMEQQGDDLDEVVEGLPVTQGVYGCTQGPRLETAAEIIRLKQDGCDMVGMTGMPEAGLARELGMEYACLALSVNRAAGLEKKPITMEDINHTLVAGMAEVKKLIPVFARLYAADEQARHKSAV